MKKILLSMCAMVIALAVTAQSVKVYKGGEVTYELAGADSIVFSEKVIPVASITLDKTEVTLGLPVTISVTSVLPENATDKTYTWLSSDTTVVAVDENGVVTGMSGGTATVTAVANDGSGVTASCTVTVNTVQLWENGPYWATCNVGASSPLEYGYYFTWGDPTAYRYDSASSHWVKVEDGSPFEFQQNNNSCPTYNKYYNLLRSDGYVDMYGNLIPQYDAATVHLGSPWRMPTLDEFKALNSNCSAEWTDDYKETGAAGELLKGTGAYASRSLFLCSPGYGDKGDKYYFPGERGFYYSSTEETRPQAMGITTYWNCSAWGCSLRSNYFDIVNDIPRYTGRSVRAVCDLVSVTEITLDKSELELSLYGDTTLTATVSPSDASNQLVHWSSSDNSVAIVSIDGVVRGLSAGTATITAATIDGSVASTCTVTVTSDAPVSHDYVDLGLPSGLKWATCNIGANSPEEYGDYYPIQKTMPLKFGSGRVDERTDAAQVQWGGSWRLPTSAEQQELIDNCTWAWTEDYNSTGVAGYIGTSNNNSNSIFLPAAGQTGNARTYTGVGSNFFLWSSTPTVNNSAYAIQINSGTVSVAEIPVPNIGQSVRAVLNE